MVKLHPHQEEALERLKSGKVLVGGVGSGKSLVGASWALKQSNSGGIVVITTARKRDTLDWVGEFAMAGSGMEGITVDSWNNISKYADARDTVFIFDEQRVVGSGKWVKVFLKITKHNKWILLSATPGDTWLDYMPLFLANGFYKNKTEFYEDHVVWDRFARYPRVKRFVAVHRLEKLRRRILVDMPVARHTVRNRIYVPVRYRVAEYNEIMKKRFDPYKKEPIASAGELCHVLRKCVNQDRDRLEAVRGILKKRSRIIVFYNFDYELEALRELSDTCVVKEWNGHKHEPVPDGERWVYLVQYASGAEAWNCTVTDTIVFYSLNYSWKVMEQSEGRIDRMNTPFTNLWYYFLESESAIDQSIKASLSRKKKFNEKVFADSFWS
nr:MAG TPA: Chromatin remodeling complex ATPase [Caudoviricetes sp.]